jgi:hypothetical protein
MLLFGLLHRGDATMITSLLKSREVLNRVHSNYHPTALPSSRSPRSPPWFLIDFSEEISKWTPGNPWWDRNRSNSSKFTQNEPDGNVCVITWPGMIPEKAIRIATKCLNLTEKIRRFLPHVRETRMGANGSRNPKHLKSHSSCLSNRDFGWQTVCVLGLNRPGRPPGKKNSVKPNVERLESRHRDAKRRLRLTSPPQGQKNTKHCGCYAACSVCVCSVDAQCFNLLL